MERGLLVNCGGILGGPLLVLLLSESELSLGGLGGPFGPRTMLIISSGESGSLKGLLESFFKMFQACQGGYRSLADSFGAAEAVLMIAPSLVLLVILEIGGASGKVTPLGFLGDNSPETVGRRSNSFRGVVGLSSFSPLGR